MACIPEHVERLHQVHCHHQLVGPKSGGLNNTLHDFCELPLLFTNRLQNLALFFHKLIVALDEINNLLGCLNKFVTCFASVFTVCLDALDDIFHRCALIGGTQPVPLDLFVGLSL